MKNYQILFFTVMISVFNLNVFSQTGSEYFPLTIGNHWVYEYVATGKQAEIPKKDEIYIEAADEQFGENGYRLKNTAVQNGKTSNSYSWYRKDNEGNIIYCALGSSPVIILINWDPPIIMISNNSTKIDASWEHFLELHHDDYPDSTFYEKTTFTVDSISETITVPAGTFNNCLKIRGIHTNGEGDTLRVFYTYYAEGIGKILHILESPQKSAFRSELVEYSVK